MILLLIDISHVEPISALTAYLDNKSCIWPGNRCGTIPVYPVGDLLLPDARTKINDFHDVPGSNGITFLIWIIEGIFCFLFKYGKQCSANATKSVISFGNKKDLHYWPQRLEGFLLQSQYQYGARSHTHNHSNIVGVIFIFPAQWPEHIT